MPFRAIDPALRGHQKPAPATDAIVTRRRIRPVAGSTADPVPPASTARPPKRQHHIVDRSTNNWDENGDYIVGKGRPPKAHQWQPGQSGNPKGPKAKEKLTPQQAFDQELMAEFNIKKNGEDVAVNLGSFAISLLKKQAAEGTVKAQEILLRLFLDTVRKHTDQTTAPEMDEWEKEIVDFWLEELKLPERPVRRKPRISPESQGDEA